MQNVPILNKVTIARSTRLREETNPWSPPEVLCNITEVDKSFFHDPASDPFSRTVWDVGNVLANPWAFVLHPYREAPRFSVTCKQSNPGNGRRRSYINSSGFPAVGVSAKSITDTCLMSAVTFRAASSLLPLLSSEKPCRVPKYVGEIVPSANRHYRNSNRVQLGCRSSARFGAWSDACEKRS